MTRNGNEKREYELQLSRKQQQKRKISFNNVQSKIQIKTCVHIYVEIKSQLLR